MKTLIATLVLAMSSFAYAEEAAPEEPQGKGFKAPLDMTCSETDKVISMIKNVEEGVIWIGTGVAQTNQSLYTSIATNDKTGAWTLFMTNKERGISCIVSYGTTNTDYVDKENL